MKTESNTPKIYIQYFFLALTVCVIFPLVLTLPGAVFLCPIYAFAVGYLISTEAKENFKKIDPTRTYTLKEINTRVIHPILIKYCLLIALPTAVYAHFPREKYTFLHQIYQQAIDANGPYFADLFSFFATIGGLRNAGASPTMVFNYFFPFSVSFLIIIPAVIALIPASISACRSLCLDVQFPTENSTRKLIGPLFVVGFSIAIVDSMVNHIHMFDLRELIKVSSMAKRVSQFISLLVLVAIGLLLFIPHLIQSFKKEKY